MPSLFVLPSILAASQLAAGIIMDAYLDAQRQSQSFYVALSGGTTPQACYRELASRDTINWTHVQLFQCDERYVDHSSPHSNYAMLMATLIKPAAIPTSCIHPITTTLTDPFEAAQEYSQLLSALLPSTTEGIPVFDLLVLGVGVDGHTASLFPNTDILHSNDIWCDAVYLPASDSWRISLTLPVIKHAKKIIILVTGMEKAAILRKIFVEQDHSLPIAAVMRTTKPIWILDQDAAKHVPPALITPATE